MTDLLYLRDLAEVEPPRDRYQLYDKEDIYRHVPRPQWTGLDDEIWTARNQENDSQLEKVKALIKKQNDEIVSGRDGSLSGMRFAARLQRKHKANPKVRVRKFIDHKISEILMAFFTIWALFAEDIRIAALPKEVDKAFAIVNLVVLVVFLAEVMLRSYAQRSYFGSFFFVLDCVATFTLVFDIYPAFEPPVDASSDSGGGQSAAQQQLQMARVGRSARVGTRVGRLLRLLRVLRVLKLFLAARKKKVGEDVQSSQGEKDFPPSELGKMLKNKVSHKVISFVMLLIIGVEMLGPASLDVAAEVGLGQVYYACPSAAKAAIELEPYRAMVLKLGRYFNNPFDTALELDSPVQGNEERAYVRDRMVHLQVYSQVYWDIPDPHGADEYPDCTLANFYKYTKHEIPRLHGLCPGHISELRQDELKPVILMESILTIKENLFSTVTETFDSASGYCTDCADQLPLNASLWLSQKTYQQGNAIFGVCQTLYITLLLGVMAFLFSRDMDNLVIRPIESMVDSVTRLAANPAHKLEAVKSVKYETDALRVSLNKIAQLLQVGFGEAGNNLVAENLKKGDTVDPMVPGKKLLGAYGFCIIDEYEEVLDCLGEEILPFTNMAAQVLHDAVTHNGGQPNRNLGDAFLCVWKPQMLDNNSPVEDLRQAEQKMCDGALTAFRRSVREISRSAKLQAFNKNEEIIKYFDGEHRTVIGYGLNYGYAIEGAVGTNIKIDCSYLSPNVNLAARLESATKRYGVNILMSQYFYDKLSPAVKQGLRRVDVVCLKGSSIPMSIYTCDRSNALYVDQAAIDKYGAENVISEFQRIFEEGVDHFVQGDWASGKECFETCLTICPRDKPARRLLMHMDTAENHPDFGLATEGQPFLAPEGWPGYHFLLSK